MSVTIKDFATAVACDDPHGRGCTEEKSLSVLKGDERSRFLRDHGWSTDLENGAAICPTCRAIPFGGDDVAGKLTLAELLEHYECLCARAAVEQSRQPDNPMLDRTLKHMGKYKAEVVRRLKLIPLLEASPLQPR